MKPIKRHRSKPIRKKISSFDFPVKNSKRKLIFFAAGTSFVAIFISCAWIYSLGVFSLTKADLTPITEYRPKDNSLIFDREDKKIGELFSSYYVYTPLKDIPQQMIQAILSVEDRSFYSHFGIDIKAILRAIVDIIKTKSMSQGASTITQQVVRNLILSREKTVSRKAKEIILSLYLERHLPKDKILEIYLNAIFLGNGSYGVGAASLRYFGKKLSELDTHELALIAGLFQSPSAYNPHKHPDKARSRQRIVLVSMARSGYISIDEAKSYMRKKLVFSNYSSLNSQTAPYFIDYIRERTESLLGQNAKNAGLRIYTTLDSQLQQKAQFVINKSADILDESAKFLSMPDSLEETIETEDSDEELVNSSKVEEEKSEVKQEAQEPEIVEAALLSTDPKTGHILAMVGGRNYDESQYNRAIHAHRSPGSAIKPIVYSLALEGDFKWSDMLYVSPIAVDDYRPKNYSKSSYLTETTLLRAFYKSINTPTVEIAQKLGLNHILEHAKKMGVQSVLKNEIGTILGGSEVSMLDMSRVYGTIANAGTKIQPIAIRKITDRSGKILYQAPSIEERSEVVLTPQSSFLVQEGLRSVFEHGTAISHAHLFSHAVGKTGTSNHAKDNWFCGYTPKLVTIVWAGVDRHRGFESSVSASTLALPIWGRYFEATKPDVEGEFVVPEGIILAKVHPKYGFRDPEGIPMYFIEGKEPTEKASNMKVISRSGSYRKIFDR